MPRVVFLFSTQPDVLRWTGLHLQHRVAQHRHDVLPALLGFGNLGGGVLGPDAGKDWEPCRLSRRHSLQGTLFLSPGRLPLYD